MVLRYIDPRYVEPHYSTKLWRVIKQYCDHFYGKDLFADICSDLQMPVEYLLEDDNWVSNFFGSLFFDRLKETTNESDLFKNIGTFLIAKENINPFEYLLIKSVPPFLFFNSIPSSYAKVNQINHIRCVVRRPGNFILEVWPKSHVKAHPDVCQNTIGVWQGLQEVYKLDSLNVEEIACIHKGAERCVFQVRYKALRFWLKRFAHIFCLFIGGTASYKLAQHSRILETKAGSSIFFVALWISIICLVAYYRKFHQLINYNRLYYEQSRVKNQTLYNSRQKLDRRYRESHLLRQLSEQLIKSKTPAKLIEQCMLELQNNFGYERSLVMLLSSDRTRLFTAATTGFISNESKVHQLSFQYPGRQDTPQIFANILQQGKSVLISDIAKFKANLKIENQRLIDSIDAKSLIVAPLQDATEKYGLIVVGAVGQDRPMTKEDLYLLEEISKLFSISFQNVRNFEREETLRSIFQKYVPRIVIESIDSLSAQRGFIEPTTANITSMFIDLRGFTSTSENLPPEKTVDLLNIYITFVSKTISQCGGIVDNLVGDGIVVFFSDSQDSKANHALRAIYAALCIARDISSLNYEFERKGYPRAKLGIGLNTGNATVGNLGSEIKMNFTAIGDTVNVAARLQDLCKKIND